MWVKGDETVIIHYTDLYVHLLFGSIYCNIHQSNALYKVIVCILECNRGEVLPLRLYRLERALSEPHGI